MRQQQNKYPAWEVVSETIDTLRSTPHPFPRQPTLNDFIEKTFWIAKNFLYPAAVTFPLQQTLKPAIELTSFWPKTMPGHEQH